MPFRFRVSRLAPMATICLALLPVFSSSAGAQCSPAVCGVAPVHITFESLTPGSSVEGLGTVHPILAITSIPWTFGPTCTPGTAGVIEDNNTVLVSYSTGPGSSTPNGCLNARGFGDSAGCVLDYDFTFAPGVTINCFSIRMVDYGDLLPGGGGTHEVFVQAYDASNALVDTDVLTMVGNVNLVAGDACTAQAGDPGNHVFTVSAPGIVKVTLRFDASPDPNVGFDDIMFCLTGEPTPAERRSWGQIKTLYRD
jgi:hypothetical protein